MSIENSYKNIIIRNIANNKIIKKINPSYFIPESIIYYSDSKNKEEYLLSSGKRTSYFFSDYFKIIVFDIQNNFQEKIIIENKLISSAIYNALLLFNVFEKKYIIISSDSVGDFTKLYDFKSNNSFIKNIYGTDKNKINYMIPWSYNNNWYIIDLCEKKISINNLLADECYSELTYRGMDNCFKGHLHNNVLYVFEFNNFFGVYKIRIFDLVKNQFIKLISNYNDCIYDIIPWNNNYGIILLKDKHLYVINLENQNIETSLDIITKGYNKDIKNIKRIKLDDLGECIICLCLTENKTYDQSKSYDLYLYNEINY